MGNLKAMTRALLIAATLLLAGCASLPSPSEGVTLSVRSYDRVTGAYVLELRNNASRPILYLDPYRTFHTVRSPIPIPFPESQEEIALMVHGTKLPAGGSVTFSGTCTESGACSRLGTYVAIHACWFTDTSTCRKYSPIWSETPLNAM